MQLEDHFDFLASDDIRFRTSRIGIESVLYEYIHRGQGPQAIQERFPSLTLAQVHAAILYYLYHREELDAYLTSWLEHADQVRKAQAQHPPVVLGRLERQVQSEGILSTG